MSPKPRPLAGAFVLLSSAAAPASAQYVPPVAPACQCGPSAMPRYVPAPQPALRPLDYSPRSGVTYRDGGAFKSAPTGLGASSHPAYILPALWAGGYIGAHAGYGLGTTTLRDVDLGRVGRSGPFGGVHLGYNWQAGGLVLGVEGDLSAHTSEGRKAFASGLNATTQRDWTSSLRARAGFASGNTLFYATGGLAFAGQTVVVSEPGLVSRGRDIRTGYVLGAGLDWKMMSNVSLRAEVLHYRFGDKDLNLAGGNTPVRSDDTVVRAGITLHLN